MPYHYIGISFGEFRRILEHEGAVIGKTLSFASSQASFYVEFDIPGHSAVRIDLPELRDEEDVPFNSVRSICDIFRIDVSIFCLRV